MEFTYRNELLLGKEALNQLKSSHVRVFGVGGVGSFVVEALVRSGIGHLSLVDFDTIDLTNCNRQLIALNSTLGQLKVEVLKQRCLDINPQLQIEIYPLFYEAEDQLSFEGVDYVVDAIDSVPSKLKLMSVCEHHDIPLIMALGTGRKLDPSQLKLSSLYKTDICPLAKKVRSLAKQAHLKDIPVVYSSEPALPATLDESSQKIINGSMIFVPASAGLLIASKVVKDLIQGPRHR